MSDDDHYRRVAIHADISDPDEPGEDRLQIPWDDDE